MVLDMCTKIIKRVETEVKKARKAFDQGEISKLKIENAKMTAYKTL